MVLLMLINILFNVLTIVFNLISQLIPGQILIGPYFHILSTIMSITQQALNFMYLIFGETLFIVLPIAIFVMIIKYAIIPIIQIFRSFFIKGSE